MCNFGLRSREESRFGIAERTSSARGESFATSQWERAMHVDGEDSSARGITCAARDTLASLAFANQSSSLARTVRFAERPRTVSVDCVAPNRRLGKGSVERT